LAGGREVGFALAPNENWRSIPVQGLLIGVHPLTLAYDRNLDVEREFGGVKARRLRVAERVGEAALALGACGLAGSGHSQ
jgi:hypothetical protein